VFESRIRIGAAQLAARGRLGHADPLKDMVRRRHRPGGALRIPSYVRVRAVPWDTPIEVPIVQGLNASCRRDRERAIACWHSSAARR